MRSLQPVLALLERGREERLTWRSEAELALCIHRDLVDAPPQKAAKHVTALVRLAIALTDLESPSAHVMLVDVLEREPLVPQQLRTARELRAARAAAVTGAKRTDQQSIDETPGRPRGDLDLHQRRWADLDRRRAVGRR